MINIESYTCAACGALVDIAHRVPGAPTHPRPCGHDDAKIHANLRGTLYGVGAVESGKARALEHDMPADQLEAFRAWAAEREIAQSAPGEWHMRDWYAYREYASAPRPLAPEWVDGDGPLSAAGHNATRDD